MRTKKEKRIDFVLIIFFILISIFPLFLALKKIDCPIKVEAENSVDADVERYPISDKDGIFGFSTGAGIRLGNGDSIQFTLNLYKERYVAFAKKDIRIYRFILYIQSNDGKTMIPQTEYYFIWYDQILSILSKKISTAADMTLDFSAFMTYSDKFDYVAYLNGEQSKNNETPDLNKMNSFYTAFKKDGYTVEHIFDFTNDYKSDLVFLQTETNKQFMIYHRVNDIDVDYFIRFEYSIKKFIRKESYGFLNSKERDVYDKPIEAKIDSSVCSVAYIVNAINNSGNMELEFPTGSDERKRAEEILNEVAIKKIKVRYLQEIEGTPFASVKIDTCEVPVRSETILYDLIASSLNKTSFSVFGNEPTMGFKLDKSTQADSMQTFVADYGFNKWISGKSVDGNSANYFCSINKSFYDYYHPMTNDVGCDGIFDNELYQYILTKIKNKYPKLNSYEASEIYGYFGYIIIPESHTLNGAWANLFNTDTTMTGQMFVPGDDLIQIGQKLSKSQYKILLNKYNYSWLAREWNSFMDVFETNAVNANSYLFYIESENTMVSINENGADDFFDDDPAAKNDMEDLGDWVIDTWNSIKDTPMLRNFKILVVLIAIILLIGLIIKFFNWVFKE